MRRLSSPDCLEDDLIAVICVGVSILEYAVGVVGGDDTAECVETSLLEGV